MSRPLNKLGARSVQTRPSGKHSDGGGLWLVKTDQKSGYWVLRFTIHGRRREMGLGSIAIVSLKTVREDAAKWRAVAVAGLDPIVERERLAREAAHNLHLFNDVTCDCFEALKKSLKKEGKAGRWRSPLDLHVLPKLGKTPVSQIGQIDIRDALKGIWLSKPDVARKALNRISVVFKHAAALGLDVDLQAPTKARALLGAQGYKPEHIPAVPWPEVADFYASLNDGSLTHLALRLLILTGVRSAPLRFIRLDQIDGDVWTIPAQNMKGREGKTEDFRVPLSGEALRVIEQAKPLARDGWLFPSVRKGVISDATMARLMERRGMKERPHGFRSSLRDWMAEATTTPHEIAETVLGHRVGNAVERAYRRTDFLAQRRVIMEQWASVVTGKTDAEISLADAA